MTFLDSFNDVFFCTGARNQDILRDFERHALHFEYDERMASFKALGRAKISGRAVAICTTSGTAVAECVPAMLEALYSKLPLILITGDRPKKLHGTGSPQTIDHEALTRSCRGSFVEIRQEDLRHLTLEDPVYPVHVNVLVDDTVSHQEKIRLHQDLNAFASFLKGKRAPLFLFSHEEKSMRPFIAAFARTGLPFYAEALSGARDLSVLTDERQVLRLWDKGQFDGVVRVGHTPLSKIWRLLERKTLPTFSMDSRGLPGLSHGEVLPWSSERLLQESMFWDSLPRPGSAFELEKDHTLAALIEKYPRSEVAHFKRLHDSLKDQDIVYLGNSLVIRFFELIQTRELIIHGNRGVNGIDGQLATAIGIAGGTEKTVHCVLGDITTLYDLSSLGEMPANLKLTIMNNKGGRIFDMLKLDKRIVMEHERDFSAISRGFGLNYSRVTDPCAQVTELFPDREESERFLREWNA